MPIRIADYPDLLAELHESLQTMFNTQSAARVTYDNFEAAAQVLVAHAKATYEATCHSAWQRENRESEYIRAQVRARDAAKEEAIREAKL